MFQKIWDDHVIDTFPDGTCLLAVDRQMLYEGTSYQAFESLRASGRPVRRPGASIAVPDHLVPTKDRARATMTEGSRHMVEALEQNCDDFGIPQIRLEDVRQGIVHVVGPEQGFTLPGLVLVCADSHTSTHGAFGALAFGVGTSELEHVLATQTLTQHVGASGGTGHSIEFAGDAVEALSMEGRMTLCNMAVEAGARSGMVAPDETTYRWLAGRPLAPRGEAWEAALGSWRTLPSDPGAPFDAEEVLDVATLSPRVTWGTSPEHVIGIEDRVPDPANAPSRTRSAAWRRALDYMALAPGTALRDIRVDRAFIGTCTNGRLEDLRAAAAVVRGRSVAAGVRAMVTPGSGLVRRDAEREGLDRVFVEAGFEWREPGCSMCFGSGYDHVRDGERCASSSNRNFEHRQGRGARTHLMSPAMVAAAAVAGEIVDVRELATHVH
jgi:3-isopropylmalate/(R)-2-methylmalate dehydratase large subunit